MNQNIKSAIREFKDAQTSLAEGELKLNTLRTKQEDLSLRLDGITADLDSAKGRKLEALQGYAEGESSEAALSKARRDVESLERDHEEVQEMLAAVESAISGVDLTDKQNLIHSLERNVWGHIRAGIESDMPKEVSTWIGRLAVSIFRSRGQHIALQFPFGLHLPSDAEQGHLSKVADAMKQEYFH